jgi:hypothetical protein
MTAVQPQSKSRVLEEGDQALIDANTEVVEGDEKVEFVNLDEMASQDSTAPAKKPEDKTAAAPNEDDDLPPEFRGKSKKDVVKMYQEAHSAIGRQGQELGELRRRADLAIQTSLQALRSKQSADPKAAAKPADEDIDESQIFADPKTAIAKLVENHPIIKEIRETLGKNASDAQVSRAAAATERFNQAHPDSREILADPEFRQWVAASNVRRQLLLRANNHFDFEAGDEVFSTWKALKGKAQPTSGGEGDAAAADGAPTEAEVKAAASTLAKQRQAKQQAAAQAAAAPTGGASAGKPQGGKKIFRRADVLRLMETDEERYAQLAPEIELAYKEGRVR